MLIQSGKFIGTVLDRTSSDYQKRINQVFHLRYRDMICDYDKTKTGDGIDKDIYDEYCDHAVVIDTETDEIVGTYRFILKEHVDNINGKFLSETEFNIDSIKDKKIMELGRAVVQNDYRQGGVITILWRLAISYFLEKQCDYMIGTASFHGVSGNEYDDILSYIQKTYLYEKDCYAINNIYEIKDIDTDSLNSKEIFEKMPPLMKGYIRIGAFVAKNAYLDYDFNSTDLLIILDYKKINSRYLARFTK